MRDRSTLRLTRVRLLAVPERPIILALIAMGALAIRLIGIDQPFVDSWSWRQTGVAMIAENFYRDGFNVFCPRVNWAGSAPGYVGTEFPLVPAIAALFYGAFGVDEWVGRSVSLVFFLISLAAFFVLLRRIANPTVTLFAVASYSLAPLCVFSSRSFMPDMAALALSLTALALAAAWFDHGRRATFVALCVTTSLAVLVKLPSILIGLPMLYLGLTRHGSDLFRRRDAWILTAVAVLIPLAWYGHAFRISVVHPPHHFFGSGGIGFGSHATYQRILHEAVTASLTPALSIAAVVGALLSLHDRAARLLHSWLLAIFLFVLVTAPGHRHQWYLLPLVAVASGFAGVTIDAMVRACSRLVPHRVAIAAVGIPSLVVLGYSAYLYVAPLYKPWNAAGRMAGLEVDRLAPPRALVVAVDSGDLTTLYYSRRRGWDFLPSFGSAPPDSEHAIVELQQLLARGAGYLVFSRHTVWWLDFYGEFRDYLTSRYPRVRETEDYVIFDLQPR